ncbi:MAG: S9 family peptidase [Bdellovibrionales bacterium]|nr:S9 family peptidase [Oligoflexia bacterium]
MKNRKTPSCPQRPRSFKEFDHTREDPFFWLREKESPEVRKYVDSENEYFAEVMKPLKNTVDQFFEELKALIEPVAIEVPYRLGAYEYGSRTPEGAQYSVYFRKPLGTNEEQVTLDLNELSKIHEYLSLHGYNPSPDNKLLAYSLDIDGSEHDSLRVKDLVTGALLAEEIEDATGGTAWSADNTHIFYAKLNENDRPYQIYRHELNTHPMNDVLILEESDPRFFLSVQNSKDGKWVLIEAESKESTETFVIPADNVFVFPRLIEARRPFHNYSVESQGERFLILSNDGERNFKLFETGTENPVRANWNELMSGDAKIDLRELEVFENAYAVLYGDEGTLKVAVFDPTATKRFDLQFEENTYSVDFSNNHDYQLSSIRLSYSSPKTPPQTLEYDLMSAKKTVLHQRQIPHFDPDLYETKKVFAKSHDGVRVPISIFYRKDKVQGPAPTLIMGYGAYGIPYPACFRTIAVQQADHGFVFAVAHIRGGGCLGQRWYDEGKFLKKKNSFLDLIAAGEALLEQGICKKGELSIYGGSAGGMLVTAAMNLRPELFKSVFAAVPFVDVINTMLDETLPLTPTEYDEWGNPKDQKYYEYMLSYSPYDNIEAKEYPHLFMTCGWNDPRVTYWEPAKFAAKMRLNRRDDRLTLLKTNMGAGHAGQSGRFEALKEAAEMNAFLYVVHFRPELLV